MKNPLKPNILPWFTLGAGGLGLALRIWLFSGIDEKGLLPAGHPADVLVFILTAAVLAVLFLCVQPLTPISKYSRLFPCSILRVIGCVVGAVGLLYAAIGELSAGSSFLVIFTFLAGMAAAVSLAYTAWCRLRGLRPSFLFHTVITAYLMLHAVCQCRLWGAEPQLQNYFFQLLACVFLMLTGYHHTVLDSQKGSRRWFVFCGQAALFFCCLSLNSRGWPFYACMAAWQALDLCSLQVKRPRFIQEA